MDFRKVHRWWSMGATLIVDDPMTTLLEGWELLTTVDFSAGPRYFNFFWKHGIGQRQTRRVERQRILL